MSEYPAMGRHRRADGDEIVLHVVFPDGTINFSTPGVMSMDARFCTLDGFRRWEAGENVKLDV